jgi:hypothetical protein
MSQNIAKKLDIPNEWIFMYFISENCPIKTFGDQSNDDHQIYIPSHVETSKIFISNQTFKC